MTREELEKYVSELSPEMQEKARECKDMKELNALLAENDVELSEDALQAVAGGCSSSEEKFKKWIDEAYLNVNHDPNLRYQGGMILRITIEKNNRGGIKYQCMTDLYNVSNYELTREEYIAISSLPGMVKTELL